MANLEVEDNQPVIVTGFVKSGSTWAVRLIADILNSPSGASHPSYDHKEIATEGQDRPGPYIVRKGHYRLSDVTIGPALTGPHQLAWRQVTNERLIHITRDPRDIIVSAMYHWQAKTLGLLIEEVCFGGLARLPAWNDYIEQWDQIPDVKWTSYEALSTSPFQEIDRLLAGLDYDKARIIPAIDRQSFEARRKDIARNGESLYLGRDYNLRFMRKGICGDYQNILTQDQSDWICGILGEAMRGKGYDTNLRFNQ